MHCSSRVEASLTRADCSARAGQAAAAALSFLMTVHARTTCTWRMLPYSPAMPAVRHHMSSNLVSVETSLSIIEVAQLMVDRNVGAVLVLGDGQLTGILTERDVLRAVARGLRDDTRVADCMTAHPETIGPDDTTEHAVVLMLHGGFRHLPVVQGDNLVGVISIRDLVPLLLEDTAPRGV
jgi:CBS domain-containing protein